MRYVIGEEGEKYIEIVLEYLVKRGELSFEADYINLINKEISKDMGSIKEPPNQHLKRR